MTSETKTFDIESVRAEFIGKVLGSSAARYPVEYDPIRRHCHMAHDENPLFLDPEFAKQGPYGDVIAPPVMSGYFAGRGVWPPAPAETPSRDGRPGFTFGIPTPGDRGINMGISYEFVSPARVGDRLSAERRIADVFVKPIRLDPEAVWIVTESVTKNQHGEVVLINRMTTLVHGGGLMTTSTTQQVYWEDVEIGQEIPVVEMHLNWTTMVEQVHGSQDWNFVHHDPDFAQESGHSGIFYNTGWTSALLCRALTDWIGVDGWLRNLDFQMRRMNMNGDTVRARARVTGKHQGENGVVELEVWLENDREGVTTPGNAVVYLPSRPAEG